MKKSSRGYAVITVLILGMFLFVNSGSAETLADVVVKAGGISFVPQIDSPGFVLSIAAPDGSVSSETFGAGTVPSVRVSGPWQDGAYTYELKAVRSASITKINFFMLFSPYVLMRATYKKYNKNRY